MAHEACGWEGTHAGKAAPVGGDYGQTRAAADTGAEGPSHRQQGDVQYVRGAAGGRGGAVLPAGQDM